MEAWGIIMTAFALFGMLALIIVSAQMEMETPLAGTHLPIETVPDASQFKKAA